MKIKNFRYLLYKLIPMGNLNSVSTDKSKEGALLRFDFGTDGVGFADCHPWVQLGDLPLSEQLNLLSQNRLTPLTERSLYFAKIDAQYRLQRLNVFSGKVLPQNHLITFYEELSEKEIIRISTEGFRFIKLKFGKDVGAEIEFIKKFYALLKEKEIKLRLDFNSSLRFSQAENFFAALKEQIDILDFVEDPCEYHAMHWQEIQEKYGVSLALDKKPLAPPVKPGDDNTSKPSTDLTALSSPGLTGGANAFNVLVIKPALESIDDYLTKVPEQRIVFTSYMDHPLGQLCAMFEAIRFYEYFPHKREHCGFLTHNLYASHSDAARLKIEKTMLIPPITPGFGFGF